MLRFTYILILIALHSIAIQAQDTLLIAPERPKIGLVLSGGGAKGSAHIGVIKVLEENNIRPDYITGTSMGALVGGFYALGYSVEQLEEIVTSIDWDDLMADRIPLRDILIFEKDDYPGYPLTINFDNNNKPSLPSGMINGQKIQALHSKLVWKSNTYENFEDFPIPFHCVATDIISGNPYVFKEGNLAEALRSSMSIPTVFVPVDKDTMLLVDGGVTVNFAVQQCLDMGADIIIGSYTGFEEEPSKKELRSMISILTRSAVIGGVVDARTQRTKTDVFIKPNLQGLTAADFNKTSEIIKCGEIAARDSLIVSQLQKITEGLPSNKEINHLLLSVPDTTKIWVDKILVEGNNLTDSARVIKVSGLKSNTFVSAEQVDKAITRVYSSWQYNKVTYYFRTENNKKILVIKLDERSRGQIALGLHFDNYEGASFLAKITYHNLFLKSTIVEFKFSISKYPRALLSYKYYPTKNKRIELSLNGYSQVRSFPDIIKQEDYKYNIGHFEAYLGVINTRLSLSPIRNTLVEAEIGKSFNSILLKDGVQYYYNMTSINYNFDYYRIRLNINTLNDNYFPTKGLYMDWAFNSSFNAKSNRSDTTEILNGVKKENYTVRFSYKQYILIRKHFSIIPNISFGSMSSAAFMTDKFFVGGMNYSLRPQVVNLPGVKPDNISTDNYLIYGIEGQVNLFRNWFIYGGVHELFFVNYVDYSSDTEYDFEDGVIDSWNFGLGWKTKIGPIRLVTSRDFTKKDFVWSLNIGVPF